MKSGPTAGNRYYDPGADRAGRVRVLFDRIARRYDRLNDLISLGLHRRWKRRLVELADPRPGERALDLCCGTGDVARALAAHAKGAQGAEVLGIDFSDEMLGIARRTTPSACGITYRQADALELPFPDGSFDLVTVAYGLRNLADLDRGLREALRVLAPGGRLACLEFGRPAGLPLRVLYFSYLRAALPLYGLLFFGDADTYGYIFTTVSRFPGPRELAGRMLSAGFAETEVHEPMGGVMGICLARKGNARPGDAPGGAP